MADVKKKYGIGRTGKWWQEAASVALDTDRIAHERMLLLDLVRDVARGVNGVERRAIRLINKIEEG